MLLSPILHPAQNAHLQPKLPSQSHCFLPLWICNALILECRHSRCVNDSELWQLLQKAALGSSTAPLNIHQNLLWICSFITPAWPKGGKGGTARLSSLWSKIRSHLLILMSWFPLFICMIIRKMRSNEVYLFIYQRDLNKKDIAVSYYTIRGVDFPNSKLLKVVRQEVLTPSCASATANLCWQTSPILLMCEIFYSIDSWNQFLLSKLKFCWPLMKSQVSCEVEGTSLSLNLSIIYFCFPFGERCQSPQTPNCTHKTTSQFLARGWISSSNVPCILQGWVQLKTLSLKRIGLSAE